MTLERESERVNEMGMLVSLRELKMSKLPTATVTPIPVSFAPASFYSTQLSPCSQHHQHLRHYQYQKIVAGIAWPYFVRLLEVNCQIIKCTIENV